MQDLIKLLAMVLCVFFLGCIDLEKKVLYGDKSLFKDTPAWELVCAIENENTKEITHIIIENPPLLDYKEPKYGLTPLFRAVGKRKYKSAETLLKLGANPNVRLIDGFPLIFEAIEPEWGSLYVWEKDTRMLELLLKYGADPNYNAEDTGLHLGSEEADISPLILANDRMFKIEKTKLLVEHGADIDYATKHGTTAAIRALESELIENAYYLIVENEAKISDPYYTDKFRYDKTTDKIVEEIDYDRPLYPVDELLDWMYPLDSKEYKLKKEIIKAFEAQGIDYNQRKIDGPKWKVEPMKKRIQNEYPDNWEEYFEKY